MSECAKSKEEEEEEEEEEGDGKGNEEEEEMESVKSSVASLAQSLDAKLAVKLSTIKRKRNCLCFFAL